MKSQFAIQSPVLLNPHQSPKIHQNSTCFHSSPPPNPPTCCARRLHSTSLLHTAASAFMAASARRSSAGRRRSSVSAAAAPRRPPAPWHRGGEIYIKTWKNMGKKHGKIKGNRKIMEHRLMKTSWGCCGIQNLLTIMEILMGDFPASH